MVFYATNKNNQWDYSGFPWNNNKKYTLNVLYLILLKIIKKIYNQLITRIFHNFKNCKIKLILHQSSTYKNKIPEYEYLVHT